MALTLILLALTVAAGTAITFFISNAVHHYSPVLMSGVRLFVGGFLIAGIALLTNAPFLTNLELWRFGVVSALVFTVPHALIFSALTDKAVNENDVAFIEAAAPCLIFAWDLIFHTSAQFETQIACVLLVFAGVIFFLAGNHQVKFSSWQEGHAKILLSAVILACGLIVMPVLLPRSILTSTNWFRSISSKLYDTALLLIFAGILSLILYALTRKTFSQLKNDCKVIRQITFWKHVLLLSMIGTVIGWGTGTWLNFENPVYFSVAIVLIPIATALYKSFFQNIKMTLAQNLGASAIFVGSLVLIYLKNS